MPGLSDNTGLDRVDQGDCTVDARAVVEHHLFDWLDELHWITVLVHSNVVLVCFHFLEDRLAALSFDEQVGALEVGF